MELRQRFSLSFRFLIMRYFYIILLALSFAVNGYSQPSGYVPKSGVPFFLRDAQGRLITTQEGGILSLVSADTATSNLVQPPDTAQVFNITMVNPGDVSTPPLATGVQAYWSFEETSGATAYDSAASYDGTLINAPTLMQTGKSNYCYRFTKASDQCIDFSTSMPDPGTGDFTVAGWIKINAGSLNQGIIGCSGDYPYWIVMLQGLDKIQCVVNFAGGEILTISTNSISPGYVYPTAYYHFVYMLDRDGTTYLYVNNVLQADQDDISAYSATNLTSTNNHAIAQVGNHHPDRYLDGWTDEISIYDRLLSPTEVSNLYNLGEGKFWPYGVSGGDTLNMTIAGEDTRADTMWVLWKYDGWAADTTDGTKIFKFPIDDMEAYRDTNFLWSGFGDTTVYFTAHTKWGTEVTEKGNQDTVFIDSSDITPPIQDPGGDWDIIFYCDYENNDAESNYEKWDKEADWNNFGWFDSENHWPSGWAEEGNPTEDSIVIDELTGSKVVQYIIVDDIIDGFACLGPNTHGESIYMDLPPSGQPGTNGYHELYVSFNVQFMSKEDPFGDYLGFGWSSAGKLGGGVRTNQAINHGDFCPLQGFDPTETPGWTNEVLWDWYYPGRATFYMYYPGMNCPYGDQIPQWNSFHPTGDGIQYNPQGYFYFNVDVPRWYNVTVRYVVNTFSGTSPNYDGIIEGFINGRLISQKSDFYMLNYIVKDMQINTLFHRFFNGGGNPPTHDAWAYLDDFYVFTYGEDVEGIPRGNVPSLNGRILSLPNWPKEVEE